jgi:HD domain
MTNYITLHDGSEIDLMNPDLMNVQIETLLIQLYRTFRYNGATKRPYCVLEHSVRGARVALDSAKSPGLGAYRRAAANAFLLHDMHEAIIGDIATPVARVIGRDAIAELKDRIDRAVLDSFGPDNAYPKNIVTMVTALDAVMFQREWLDLMPTGFDRASNDGPTADFMVEECIHPEPIDPYVRPSFQSLIGEFLHLMRVTK